MVKLLLLEPREVIKVLKKNGFEFRSQKGSHRKFIKIANGKNYRVIVPMHDKEIKRGTLLDIITRSGKTKEEFMSEL